MLEKYFSKKSVHFFYVKKKFTVTLVINIKSNSINFDFNYKQKKEFQKIRKQPFKTISKIPKPI